MTRPMQPDDRPGLDPRPDAAAPGKPPGLLLSRTLAAAGGGRAGMLFAVPAPGCCGISSPRFSFTAGSRSKSRRCRASTILIARPWISMSLRVASSWKMRDGVSGVRVEARRDHRLVVGSTTSIVPSETSRSGAPVMLQRVTDRPLGAGAQE